MTDTGSPFEPADAELANAHTRCPGCGTTKPIQDMSMSLDQTSRTGDDAVLSVTRFYVCSTECATDMLATVGDDS